MTEQQPRPAAASPRPSASIITLMWAIAAIAALCDQLTKHWMLTHLTAGVDHPVLGDWLRWRLLFNPGAAFSIGTNITWVFTLLQFSFAAIILLIAARRIHDYPTAVGLALIAGGALGNFIDRVFRAPGLFIGHVVDFVSVGSFAVFNVADSCITCGVALFIVAKLIEERRRPTAPVKGSDK